MNHCLFRNAKRSVIFFVLSHCVMLCEMSLVVSYARVTGVLWICLFYSSCSVIAPEASGGPRHLIDGSLMEPLATIRSSHGSESMDDSSSYQGMAVHS